MYPSSEMSRRITSFHTTHPHTASRCRKISQFKSTNLQNNHTNYLDNTSMHNQQHRQTDSRQFQGVSSRGPMQIHHNYNQQMQGTAGDAQKWIQLDFALQTCQQEWDITNKQIKHMLAMLIYSIKDINHNYRSLQHQIQYVEHQNQYDNVEYDCGEHKSEQSQLINQPFNNQIQNCISQHKHQGNGGDGQKHEQKVIEQNGSTRQLVSTQAQIKQEKHTERPQQQQGQKVSTEDIIKNMIDIFVHKMEILDTKIEKEKDITKEQNEAIEKHIQIQLKKQIQDNKHSIQIITASMRQLQQKIANLQTEYRMSRQSSNSKVNSKDVHDQSKYHYPYLFKHNAIVQKQIPIQFQHESSQIKSNASLSDVNIKSHKCQLPSNIKDQQRPVAIIEHKIKIDRKEDPTPNVQTLVYPNMKLHENWHKSLIVEGNYKQIVECLQSADPALAHLCVRRSTSMRIQTYLYDYGRVSVKSNTGVIVY